MDGGSSRTVAGAQYFDDCSPLECCQQTNAAAGLSRFHCSHLTSWQHRHRGRVVVVQHEKRPEACECPRNKCLECIGVVTCSFFLSSGPVGGLRDDFEQALTCLRHGGCKAREWRVISSPASESARQQEWYRSGSTSYNSRDRKQRRAMHGKKESDSCVLAVTYLLPPRNKPMCRLALLCF